MLSIMQRDEEEPIHGFRSNADENERTELRIIEETLGVERRKCSVS